MVLCGDRPPPNASSNFCGSRPTPFRNAEPAQPGGSASGATADPGHYCPSRTSAAPRPERTVQRRLQASKQAYYFVCCDAKADPNYRDRQNNTPLHMACLPKDGIYQLLLAGSDGRSKMEQTAPRAHGVRIAENEAQHLQGHRHL